MVIQFLCPNGHKIHCPEDRAGKPAKCPKCGAKFRVPEPEAEGEEDEEPEEDSGDDGPQSGSAPATAEEQIEFLCPNGHRLHGPTSLQGKAGECPECGSRFRVPSYDDVPDEEEVDEQQPQQQISLTDSDDLVTLQEAQADSGGSSGRIAGGSGASSSSVGLAGPSTAGPKPHPLAGLLAKLWAAKPQEAVVELQLGNGEKITPQRFFKNFSSGSHGLFAVEEDDGTYTLIATAWDSIQRLQFRCLKRLPDSLHE
jgi:hypothetical protein